MYGRFTCGTAYGPLPNVAPVSTLLQRPPRRDACRYDTRILCRFSGGPAQQPGCWRRQVQKAWARLLPVHQIRTFPTWTASAIRFRLTMTLHYGLCCRPGVGCAQLHPQRVGRTRTSSSGGISQHLLNSPQRRALSHMMDGKRVCRSMHPRSPDPCLNRVLLTRCWAARTPIGSVNLPQTGHPALFQA